ncbi:ImmA/IrrE family metallo-endopeptidase [Lactobacillus terrae]|uniref:ImmA/IrrE family metallo-endopeptidase n=1 Tax=Lactobacillus terrae TaxID=2269374 RepID=UPI001472E669|nr:ImmA/IrrE family metallo-endopeptidase [Lactobacillus terrae]
MDYLFNYAYDHKISIISTYLLPEEENCSSYPSKNMIIINMNLKNKKQLPFQIAHEIGHVLNNHDSMAPLYFTNSKNKIEFDANKTAIQILADFYIANSEEEYINPEQFMDTFDVLPHLHDEVYKYMNNKL